MTPRSAATPVLLLVAIAILGCNATAAPPLPTATPAPAATPTVTRPAITTPAAVRGTWIADVEGTTASSGTWTMVISETNLTLQNPVGGEPFPLDPTSFTETSIVFPPGEDCPDQSVVTAGTYTYALTNNQLVISLVGDSCGDRSATLVSVPWQRKP